jgi:hypothetical protein
MVSKVQSEILDQKPNNTCHETSGPGNKENGTPLNKSTIDLCSINNSFFKKQVKMMSGFH